MNYVAAVSYTLNDISQNQHQYAKFILTHTFFLVFEQRLFLQSCHNKTSMVAMPYSLIVYNISGRIVFSTYN